MLANDEHGDANKTSPATPTPDPAGSDQVTYVVPVKGVIEKGLLEYVVRRGLNQAARQKASAIIFDMDTPGGTVATAETIMRLLLDLPPNVKTYAFVDKDALSAGAFIALCTDEIYMAPGSRIGAAAVITTSGDIPEGDLKEKVVSATLALVLRAAKAKGYDSRMVESMVRRDVGFRIGDEMLCPTNRLLTLSDIDAQRLIGEGDQKRPLLSRGTARNLDELLGKIGREHTKVVVLRITWAEELARRITMLRGLFLLAGLLGLYVEFKTPGFGLPGILGSICLVLFFWGHFVAGTAGAEEILLFAVGAVLIALEVFLIPGAAVPGILGIACVVASLLMAMIQHMPGMPWTHVYFPDLEGALVTLGGSLVGAAVLALFLVRFLPETRLFHTVSLDMSASASRGFVASANTQQLVGLKGVAVTDLRPGGTAMFGDLRLDVVSRGDFIDREAPIVVAEVEGNRIVVDKT